MVWLLKHSNALLLLIKVQGICLFQWCIKIIPWYLGKQVLVFLHQELLSLDRILITVCSSLLWSPGSLIQVPSVERGKLSKVRLGSLSLKKEGERQCFLFTKHFLICTRSSGGKLHLLKVLVLHIPFMFCALKRHWG